MIIYWQNHVGGKVGAHHRMGLGIFDNPQNIGVLVMTMAIIAKISLYASVDAELNTDVAVTADPPKIRPANE